MRLTFIAIAFLLFANRGDYTRWLCGHSVLTNCDSPAIRLGRRAIAAPSGPRLPLQSNGVRWNVIGSECHRYGGKVPDEYGDIRQSRVPQQLHGALIKSLRYDTRGYQCTGHVIDNLLPRVVKDVCKPAISACAFSGGRPAFSLPPRRKIRCPGGGFFLSRATENAPCNRACRCRNSEIGRAHV